MPVDEKRLDELVDELKLNDADKAYFKNVFKDNPDVAIQFVGQRERHDAFTRKTQELSVKERELNDRVNGSVTEYAKQLQAAEDHIRQIMTDLENERISKTKAETLLQKVKAIYNLTDDDIPKVDAPPPKKDEPILNLEEKFKEFKSDLLKELNPILRSLPRVASTQQEIYARHMELTGKRLTQKEMNELIETVQKTDGLNLESAWREKYDIGKIEKDREHDEWSKAERQKWDDELKRKNSEEALRGVRHTADGNFNHLSPVFRTYQRQDGTVPPEKPANEPSPKLSGAERAAQKWVERRQAGVPLGKEEAVGDGVRR